MQVSQLQEPTEGLNLSPKPVRGRAAAVWGEGVDTELEPKPGALRISSTLPCLRVLAGLKGPSNSSLVSVSTVLFFTARVMGEALASSLDTDGPVFMTGALNVKPDDGENDGGLAGVALTMGEEKVKGTEGGDVGGGALLSGVWADAVEGAKVGAGVLVTTAGAGTRAGWGVEDGEVKLNVGSARVLMGREMAGRSGTSAASSSAGRLLEGRTLLRSRFILPPPEPAVLAAGVLDRG